MEVHHHPHVEQKSFKQYFLEFLMIFLAVTLGFFAESLRENISDREKEKQYIELLAQDLKKDTAALHYSVARLNRDITNEDSIVSLFAKGKLKEKNDSDLITLTILSGLSVDIIFNDRAASQLKNSGSMRLVRNRNVAESILQYWNNQIKINQIHDRFENIRKEHHEISYKTFSWYQQEYVGSGGSDSAVFHAQVKAIINEQNLIEFVNIVSNLYNAATTQYLPQLEIQLQLATQLIGLIQKEYGLPD